MLAGPVRLYKLLEFQLEYLAMATAKEGWKWVKLEFPTDGILRKRKRRRGKGRRMLEKNIDMPLS